MIDKREKSKRANMITAIGAAQVTGGVLLAFLLGIINLITSGLAWVRGVISDTGNGMGVPWIFIIGIVAGGFVIWLGIRNFKLAGGYRKVASSIKDNPAISFINLERRLFWNRKKVLRELKRQINGGFWPGAYIDMTGEQFIADGGYAIEEVNDASSQTSNEQLGPAGSLIESMGVLGQKISDQDLKTQVEKLAGIAWQIHSHIAEHPEKENTVRRMYNYFLPTTVGLLTKYTELQEQAIKTDNMTEALTKIKEVMNTLDAVYTKHLDALYKEKALDVEVEVEVLQSMAEMH